MDLPILEKVGASLMGEIGRVDYDEIQLLNVAILLLSLGGWIALHPAILPQKRAVETKIDNKFIGGPTRLLEFYRAVMVVSVIYVTLRFSLTAEGMLPTVSSSYERGS